MGFRFGPESLIRHTFYIVDGFIMDTSQKSCCEGGDGVGVNSFQLAGSEIAVAVFALRLQVRVCVFCIWEQCPGLVGLSRLSFLSDWL